jgi:hypothetical protein
MHSTTWVRKKKYIATSIVALHANWYRAHSELAKCFGSRLVLRDTNHVETHGF